MNTETLANFGHGSAPELASTDMAPSRAIPNSENAALAPQPAGSTALPADLPMDAPASSVTHGPPTPDKPPPPRFDLGALGIADELSPEEYLALLTNEQIIQDEFKNSLDVGLALAEIRDRRLYRLEDISFADYYRRKWQFSTNKVHYLTATAEIHRAITVGTDLPKPENAFQLRPLLGLALEEAKLAWAHAVKRAGGRKITARLVRAAVTELRFNAEAHATQAEVRRARAQRRQQITRTMAELLESILTRKPYEDLVQKASVLDQQLRYLLPKPRKR